ncbi:hypothetical protein HY500_01890 [Candidatus Woesearchaeota archaeon]|nr:hypothetical protein [Candidatus Woesearchaeota archaeon]
MTQVLHSQKWNHVDSGNGKTTDLSYLPDLSYYRRILLTDERNRTALAKRSLDFDIAVSVEYRDPPLSGLLSRTRLHRVTFRDSESRNLPLEVLLKVAHSGFDVVDTARRHHPELNEAMIYQYDQMRFWNSIGLPAPLVFDLIEEEHKGVPHYYLAMEFWDGVTHDLNALALSQYAKDTVGKNQEDFVESEKDQIVRSSLETIRLFHVIGTKELRSRGHGLPFVPENLEQYFIEDRGRRYFDRYLRLRLEQGLGSNYSEDLNTILGIFCGLLKPLIEPFHDKRALLYSQGDEYLHHLQYRQTNGNRITGMFDSDHVMMTRPEYSLAKLLTSHLLNLSLDQELAYVENVFLDAPQGERYSEVIKTGNIIRDYVLVSLATRLFDIGKRASDALVNDQRNARFVTGVVFRPHKITFPLKEYTPVSARYPTVSESLTTQTKALQERLNKVEQGRLDNALFPKDKEVIKELHYFLDRYSFL